LSPAAFTAAIKVGGSDTTDATNIAIAGFVGVAGLVNCIATTKLSAATAPPASQVNRDRAGTDAFNARRLGRCEIRRRSRRRATALAPFGAIGVPGFIRDDHAASGNLSTSAMLWKGHARKSKNPSAHSSTAR
jgi:hypothetical protein